MNKKWKQVCKKVAGLKGIWKFETDDMKIVEDYFRDDSYMLKWLEKAKEAEVFLFSLYIDEKQKDITFLMSDEGGNIPPDIEAITGPPWGFCIGKDNDYEGVIRWLEKLAESQNKKRMFASKLLNKVRR